MKQAITHEEWLSALLKAQAKNDGGLTSGEWAEKMGVSYKTGLERIRKASRMGWVVAGRRTSKAIDGRVTLVPVYTIREAGSK